MNPDVIISYSSEDKRLATEFDEIIGEIGYDCVYDKKPGRGLPAGVDWRVSFKKWVGAKDPQPYLIVLATANAVQKPEAIRSEVEQADANGVSIICIQFQPKAAQQLTKDAHRHYIDAELDADGLLVNKSFLVKNLRHALLRKPIQWLKQRREESSRWKDRILGNAQPSFWVDEWKRHFHLARAGEIPQGTHVLTAAGGSGKSVILAHLIEEVLKNSAVCPVMIGPEDLRDIRAQVVGPLEAGDVSQLANQIDALANFPDKHLVVFVVDGLDQMGVEGDPDQRVNNEALALLQQAAPLWITCRQEVWELAYGARVSARRQTVGLLQPRSLQRLRNRLGLSPESDLPQVLQVPLILDWTLKTNRTATNLPTTETGILHRIWSLALEKATKGTTGQCVPQEQVIAFVRDLAEKQLQRREFSIPEKEFRGVSDGPWGYQQVITELEKVGILVRSTDRASGESVVRLCHDLLDSFSMTHYAFGLSPERREAAIRAMLENIDVGGAWGVVSMMVKFAADPERTVGRTIADGLFAHFLSILDHKILSRERYGSRWMARAWGVTYVLQSNLGALLPQITRVLGGERVENQAPEHPVPLAPGLSRLEPPRVTAHAASTLASAFRALSWNPIPVSPEFVHMLVMNLAPGRWPKRRARFVEALGDCLPHPLAVNEVLNFANGELERLEDPQSADPDVFPYIAQALGRIDGRAETLGLLGQIRNHPRVRARTRRLAAESMKHLSPTDNPSPSRTEEEIIECLRPFEDRDRKEPSDWARIEEYARHVYQEMEKGQVFTSAVLNALVAALDHEQTYARIFVARALGLFVDEGATSALIRELLEPTVPTEVREACCAALRAQLHRTHGARSRQTLRFHLLRAAEVAESLARRHKVAAATAASLRKVALDEETVSKSDWLVTVDAIEIMDFVHAPSSISSRIIESREHELDPDVVDQLSRAITTDPGAEREPKFRWVAVQDASAPRMELIFSRSAWQSGRRFQESAKREPSLYRVDTSDHLLVPSPLGLANLPGIASVHVTIITSDGKVLMTQRAEHLSYYPGHWSVSLEEQITAADFVQSQIASPIHAACRGASEEVGLTVRPTDCHLLTGVLELGILNSSFIVLLSAPATAIELEQSWMRNESPKREAKAIRFLDLQEARRRPGVGLTGQFEWHPTSALRLQALSRWLNREETVA